MDVTRHTVCPHTHQKQSYHTIPGRHSSRSPATRRVYASMFRAPHWHGATHAYCPPKPRKSAWRRDITDVTRHTVSPDTHTHRSNPITRYRHSSRSPATRRVYASMFRAPHWHGAAHTYCPPRPRKSAWHRDVTDVISPRGLPTKAILSHDTANHPAHQRHTEFTPACFALPSGTAPRKRTFHQGHANTHGTAASRT